MAEALREAQKAFDKGEVPVGAVVVSGNKIIGRGHNLTEQLNDVTAHAEMQAITAAANYLGGKYLQGCTLFVTLEPCVMCAGALYWSQVSRIVVAAADSKRGYSLHGNLLHPKTRYEQGLLANDATDLLKRFFTQMRHSKS
ncbi:MAG: nucleoside deaminase [Sphingobacteriaceae bacterium]|nr:nucleoside deaminase [Sphingobacteriaceae bacterium]